jgi:hypothetical protein
MRQSSGGVICPELPGAPSWQLRAAPATTQVASLSNEFTS